MNRPPSNVRAHLVRRGLLLPLESRPTLRLDELGKRDAQRHIALYLAKPWHYLTRAWAQDDALLQVLASQTP
jgi:hypothetical protein